MDKIDKIYHCFFEQSGTFKNEFKKLGFKAMDYDIQNEFGQTDYIIDLFKEIEKGYYDLDCASINNQGSIFDSIKKEDIIVAFFPCTRFEDQIQLHFRGMAYQQKNWNMQQKLKNNLKLHKELSELYELITKLTIICIRKEIPLIIENPYSTTHYLVKYWAVSNSIVDMDRTKRGDYYKKPTQYWFINCRPKQNMVFEAYTLNERKTISNTRNKTERSMIASEYANRFIKEFII